MDATFRRPSRRVLSCIPLLVLASFAFLFLSSQDSGHHSFVLHNRRDSLQARQGSTTSTSGGGSTDPIVSATSGTGSSVAPTGSSTTSEPPFSSTASSSTTSASVSSSVSISQSSVESASSQSSTRLPSTTTLTSTRSTITPSVSPTPVPSVPIDRPATTFSITNDFLPTPAQTSSEPSSSQTDTSTVGASSSHAGFWQNKAAVAATFVIVSLVVAALGALAIMTYLKRRSKRYQERLHDELFEKYTEPESHSNSSGLSIHNSPMDAFASRDPRSDASPPFQLYGTESQRAFHPSSPVQHPDYYNTQSTPARYLSPSQALGSKGAAPPSSFHQPNNRDSYQPSIDSFYGAGPSDRIA
ncbi:hypothetical protein M413DRAFT_312296 [Hebeloma cylindrosporum]|uniref:REJ domain-containing protein n=1 Tax=Hebeloma cylindrosporum TaxID=76867 RepID=A0A0C3CQH2_HEBCY|nr:hypothetical protein M413DRAFT_312296 [Hebeloma cylindrosporum h7]